MPQPAERIVLGVDPGTAVAGYGVVVQQGSQLQLVVHGVLRLDQLKEADHPKKLAHLHQAILKLMAEHLPDEMAIESPFQGVNAQSLLKLGRAQGVVMAAAMARDVPIAEYSPSEVKKAVTGNGHASKQQVAAMLVHQLPQLRHLPPDKLDATDALAVALCHLQRSSLASRTGSRTGSPAYRNWADFVQRNAKRKP